MKERAKDVKTVHHLIKDIQDQNDEKFPHNTENIRRLLSLSSDLEAKFAETESKVDKYRSYFLNRVCIYNEWYTEVTLMNEWMNELIENGGEDVMVRNFDQNLTKNFDQNFFYFTYGLKR